ncbi:hypothetical protein Tco_1083404 [Tanacetum coccineum]
MGLLDFIKTADPRKVQAVEVQKKDDQVKLLESTSHCFMSLVTPAAGGSSSAAAPEVSAPAEVEPENVVPEDTYLDLTEPDEVATTQSGKSKRKRLVKQSDTLPAKQLRKDHPSLATGTGGKTFAGLRQLMPTSPLLDVLKCLKSSEYQGILGHALGRAVDFGIQEGLEVGYEHGVPGTQLSAIEAYNPEVARTSYFDAVRALEDVDFPLVNLLKSKKDAGMDEVLDCFILDGPLADLPEAAHLQPCLEQLSVPIHHSDDKAIVGETSLSFALLNVHSRAEGAKKQAAALRQLMIEIVSNPLPSQTWVGETSTSASPLSVEDFDEEDMDEALRSVVSIPKFEACRF